MSAEPATQLFRFCQFELPWALGPPAGRYLMRAPGAPPGAPAAHVLVFGALDTPPAAALRELPRSPPGALGRRRRRRRDRAGAPPAGEGEAGLAPVAVPSSRVTVVDVDEPLRELTQAQRWLAAAGEGELDCALAVLNRALHALRLISADPYVHAVRREQTLVARVGFGAGEQVADGRWCEAVALAPPQPPARARRARVLERQAQLAAALGGHRPLLVCEELALRARLDLSHGREREAALMLAAALDAALSELADAPFAAERLAELRASHAEVASAAHAALSGRLADDQRAVVELTLGRLQATLRARAVELTTNRG